METAQNKLLKQMVDFQKSAIDSSYHSMAALQEQGKKMVDLSMEKTPWFPDKGKKIMAEWSALFQKNSSDFKALIDKNLSTFYDFVSDAATEEKSKSAGPAKETTKSKSGTVAKKA
ncbi:MAG: hypothetical protein R6V54_15275 [Desulfobacteraceae bacterium]